MKKVFLFLTTLISLSALTIDGSAQIDRGELGSLTTVKDGLRSRRISSADKTGNNGDCVGQFKPGENGAWKFLEQVSSTIFGLPSLRQAS